MEGNRDAADSQVTHVCSGMGTPLLVDTSSAVGVYRCKQPKGCPDSLPRTDRDLSWAGWLSSGVEAMRVLSFLFRPKNFYTE